MIAPSNDGSQGAKPIKAEARAKLISAIAKARRWLDEIVTGKSTGIEAIAVREGLNERSARMALSLAFLAPDIVKAAVDGTIATRFRSLPSDGHAGQLGRAAPGDRTVSGALKKPIGITDSSEGA